MCVCAARIRPCTTSHGHTEAGLLSKVLQGMLIEECECVWCVVAVGGEWVVVVGGEWSVAVGGKWWWAVACGGVLGVLGGCLGAWVGGWGCVR